MRTIKSFIKRQRKLSPSKQLLFDKLWPKYGLDAKDKTIVPEKVFGRTAPLTLEIGFGNGENLFYLSQNQPDQDFIGVEIHVPGVANLFSLLKNQPANNLKIYNDDAITVLKECIPNNSLDMVLILFPDPWPKKRHHKRRLIQTEFIELLHQKLKKSGVINIATDWENYAEHIKKVFKNNSRFVSIDPAANQELLPKRNLTKFENRGINKGHCCFEFLFLKKKPHQ